MATVACSTWWRRLLRVCRAVNRHGPFRLAEFLSSVSSHVLNRWVAALGFGMAGTAYQSCARECGMVCEVNPVNFAHHSASTWNQMWWHIQAGQFCWEHAPCKTCIKQKTRHESIGQSFGVMVLCLAGLHRKRPVVTDLKHLLRWEGLHIRQFDVSMAWTACDH